MYQFGSFFGDYINFKRQLSSFVKNILISDKQKIYKAFCIKYKCFVDWLQKDVEEQYIVRIS